MTLLLSRYGLSDSQLLCIDRKASTLRSGQADGLQPRTLEVLKSLGSGVAEEILTEGCQMWEVAFWNPKKDRHGRNRGIERTAYVPDVAVPARYPHEITIHQGRIERILSDDLKRYSKRGIQFSTTLKSLQIEDPTTSPNAEYPVTLKIDVRQPSGEHVSKTVRAKHVIGADGAHSVVRNAIGFQLTGESKDYIWGVADFVAETDFPDIRRRSAIHSAAGSVMIIPRERIQNGDYLTRIYVQMDDSAPPDDTEADEKDSKIQQDKKEEARKRRENITFDTILTQAQKVLAPYKLTLKEGAAIDWWAAYQIGQRMTDKFIARDQNGIPRVFIAGDGKTRPFHVYNPMH